MLYYWWISPKTRINRAKSNQKWIDFARESLLMSKDCCYFAMQNKKDIVNGDHYRTEIGDKEA